MASQEKGKVPRLCHWQETVLDDRDEPCTVHEYRAAYEWLMKKINLNKEE